MKSAMGISCMSLTPRYRSISRIYESCESADDASSDPQNAVRMVAMAVPSVKPSSLPNLICGSLRLFSSSTRHRPTAASDGITMPPDIERIRRNIEGFSTARPARPSAPTANRIVRQRLPIKKNRSSRITMSAAVPMPCSTLSAMDGAFSSIAGTVACV